MRKLLLFALSMGIGTMSFAQINASVDNIIKPTGTVVLEDPANGSTIITVEITNNDTFDYPGTTRYNFNLSLDGTALSEPGGNTEWTTTYSGGLTQGSTAILTLTQSMGFEGNSGMRELCIVLQRAFIITGPHAGQNDNNDANKERCETLMFDYPASVNDIKSSEISKIITEGGLMQVYINNAGNSALIKVMNITGQMVKTVQASTGAQEFVESIDVSDLNPGVYIVTIESENGTASAKKVFIQ